MVKRRLVLLALAALVAVSSAACSGEGCGCNPVAPTPVEPQNPTPPVAACVYVVDDRAQPYTYQGGNGGFAVGTSRNDCAWTARIDDSAYGWVAFTVNNQAIPDREIQRSGNDNFNYVVAGNGRNPRTGTITITGEGRVVGIVTIRQDPRP